MTIHKAVLRTRDYVAGDGAVVPMVKDDVPLGAEYLVHAGHPMAGRKKLYNTRLCKWVEMEVVWVTSPRFANDPGGLLCAQVLEIDEGEAV